LLSKEIGAFDCRFNSHVVTICVLFLL